VNFLAVEDKIIKRLSGLGYRVYPVRDVKFAKTQEQFAPCVFVTYHGEGGIESTAQTATVKQIWLVIVVMPNERNPRSGSQARKKGGEMMGDIIPKLHGWLPEPGFTALKMSPSPVQHGWDDKYLYHPLAFTTTTRLKGDMLCQP